MPEPTTTTDVIATNATDLVSAERLEAYLSQVLLRIFNASPGLSAYVESSRAVPDDGTIEISFYKLPDEVVPSIPPVFGVQDVETLYYTKSGHACVGYRVKPTREDLSALAVDDADDHAIVSEPENGSNTDVETDADALLKRPEQPSV